MRAAISATISRRFPHAYDTHPQDDLTSDDDVGGGGGDFGRNSDSDEDAAGIRTDGGVGERDPLDRRETLVCDRLRVVMDALTALVRSKMVGRSMEKLVSSATRVFRVITKVGGFFRASFVVLASTSRLRAISCHFALTRAISRLFGTVSPDVHTALVLLHLQS